MTLRNKKYKALFNPYYGVDLLLNLLSPRIRDDEKFLKWKYYFIFKKELDLENPQTYNEKLQWLKINDIHPEYGKLVDKIEAKKYVAKVIGAKYIIPTIAGYDSMRY